MTDFLDRWFAITERGNSLRFEFVGGATTFATMAFTIFVNPANLEKAGIDDEPSSIVTPKI